MSRRGARRAAPPLLLLPPSKGKAAGGDGPAYGQVLDRPHPLAADRQEVLAAVTADLPDLDDAAVARIAGVRARDVEVARDELAALAQAPTLPAHRRYTGIVHGNAGLAAVDPARAAVDVRIVSALLGVAALDDPVPPYHLEVAARLPSLGGVGTWWRARLAAHLADLGAGRRVWDLLPAEHARVWTPSVRGALDVLTARFLRPDGRPANAARTKVCKGRLTAWLLEHPQAGPDDVAAGFAPGDGWTVRADEHAVIASFAG